MLQIQNLTKVYKGGKIGADHINIQVEAGDIFGFIGSNGAGKTTTLKCVTGLLSFEEGDVLVGGMSMKSNPLGCKKIMAYVPDNPELYDHLTGIKYLNFIADIYEVGEKERNDRIGYYANLFEISGDLTSVISSYSHGMKQKLVLIAAFMHRPQLLILDEPFVGLDPKASFLLKEQLKEICVQGGAVFFSTHVLDVAEKLCTKIAMIKNGKIIVQGPTDEVRQNESLEDFFMELVAQQ